MNQMTEVDIIAILGEDNTLPNGFNYEPIDSEFQISADEYMSYARADLRSSLDHKFINALANGKKALECRIETILKGFGLFENIKPWNFPSKVDCLSKIGILTPQVLKRINRKRNLVEHHYMIPDEEKVKDFIDVVELFLETTENLEKKFYGYAGFYNPNLNETNLNWWFEIKILSDESKVFFRSEKVEYFSNDRPTTDYNISHQEFEMEWDSPNYMKALKNFYKFTKRELQLK